MFLFDTNMVSDLVRHPSGAIGARITAAEDGAVVTSIIVAAELRFGAERRGSERLTAQLEGILKRMPVLPLAEEADRRYGELRAALERAGAPIGANDMLIAAHALALDAILVTDNVREFDRVPGLRVENWLRSSRCRAPVPPGRASRPPIVCLQGRGSRPGGCLRRRVAAAPDKAAARIDDGGPPTPPDVCRSPDRGIRPDMIPRAPRAIWKHAPSVSIPAPSPPCLCHLRRDGAALQPLWSPG
ncbi:type II toxin-antitoxin system VapC family toxin [Sphingomonas natans]|uniref:type II toxin-antitoxin system VapC family toxin n=1 Tax=Sphingomonas natans TaxID=3063330 RepID=UPI003133A023